MSDPLSGRFVVFSESGRQPRRGQIVGLAGANHCLIRFEGEKADLRLVRLERLEASTCSIFDFAEEAGHHEVRDFPED